MKPKVIISRDGRKRTCYPKFCKTCGKLYYVRKAFFEASKYCGDRCYRKGSRTGKEVNCSFCGKKIYRQKSQLKKSKSGLFFCNTRCLYEARKLESGESFEQLRPSHYGVGTTLYRKRALEKYGQVCIKCGYNANVLALEVDHIDGNRMNNSLNNLQVLCANCHRIKTLGV